MVTLGQRATKPTARVRVTSLQLKLIMAVSGAILIAFLIVHMLGNLKLFFGATAIDEYSAWLRTAGEPAVPAGTLLWVTRIVLLAAVIGHIWSAAVLTGRAHRARPVRYVHRRPVNGSYAARTMRWGGVIIALFVIYHLLDLTTGTLNPHGVHGEVAANLIADFAPERWYVTLFYALAVIALAFHVRHGVWSALQTIGRSSAATQATLKGVALVFAVLLAVGFLSVPFAVMTGLVS
ncbi:succinate dehydrogenase / fumarate reductase cytochrome b subunit [Pseudonocardia thermophila]|jgi:succinate dehydrogenase (or fumarate reductase) cytochrome b subunit, b558 family|uniref:Succinate dehydrogenase / fumarate reductase cytochrome b subunit n=1 Tax=Pseudonocardia thermophila TaxID=1848 RepID=A0A1M6QWN8_PSETH|nr:succinate dehydrogenase cytochrome b subunit [Pseudonocardia thermophila]SHK24605.1 succinate dehydrogenase / fumarate reductase cytochrome b subunit [Pseudonocardia thermophila]